ncbi:MAG: hypothetical protein QM775_21850 [Pirellulales bacterium]
MMNALPSTATAATLYWDTTDPTNNSAATGLGLGGTGTWNHSGSTGPTNVWWNAGSMVLQPWDNDGVVDGMLDTAVFWGASGTVTLADSVNLGGLGFSTTGYVINAGSNTINLNGAKSHHASHRRNIDDYRPTHGHRQRHADRRHLWRN